MKREMKLIFFVFFLFFFKVLELLLSLVDLVGVGRKSVARKTRKSTSSSREKVRVLVPRHHRRHQPKDDKEIKRDYHSPSHILLSVCPLVGLCHTTEEHPTNSETRSRRNLHHKDRRPQQRRYKRPSRHCMSTGINTDKEKQKT